MAWKRRFRRRRGGTQWLAAPSSLSRATSEAVVQSYALRNLVVSGNATGTLAALPQDLMAFRDDATGAAQDHLEERSVEARTFLRLVGMFRPLAFKVETEQQVLDYGFGGEVRYAVYRGQTDDDDADYEEVVGSATVNIGFGDQPDLWLSSHLGNERIAWLRSFIIPNRTDLQTTEATILKLDTSLVNALQWYFAPEMSVVDLRSRRKVSTDSKLYLLRQARLYDGGELVAPGRPTASLYCADYARLLARKVRA